MASNPLHPLKEISLDALYSQLGNTLKTKAPSLWTYDSAQRSSAPPPSLPLRLLLPSLL